MALAIFMTAYRPDEHCLLTAWHEADAGSPAKNIAILEVVAPEPG
jgi:hypothetical protein